MPKITKAASHLSGDEIKERIKQTTGFVRIQKWLVIYNAVVDPRPAADIAKQLGLAVQTVHNIVSAYNRQGPDALEGPGKGGRRHAYLKKEEEAAFLQPFEQQACIGRIAAVRDIKAALEQKLGFEVDDSMVYKLLKRNGWRKVVPRPSHVESDAAAQETFKKTSPRR